MGKLPRPVPWLAAGESFPPLENAWSHHDPAPGLLAAGAALDVPTLIEAYSQGIFPWFSLGQPVLWWSPDPRMVLQTPHFRLHRSLRKRIIRFQEEPGCEIRFDSDFERVINACASKPRAGQPGTWIVPDMVQAYTAFHRAGHAHSVETWINGELAGGLYCVNLGGMVFGESMFAHQTDASKIALSALVAFCRAHEIDMIDCQQNTQHLASLGAGEISRPEFVAHLHGNVGKTAPGWQFKPVYWNQLLSTGMPDLP
ncbi:MULTISPECIES: leucyl/phenylalanyl-tRNA--protein transferase [unclassified Polaromonas]|uniref:leucyl/phenylalanyl-tRNA--protein transferase n=1 Tax=unclassified Polaromonas TaxID=2638319 RepID=UPI000F086CAE|nr:MULTISPECIES: leucyl/phenylalanyl-tRNA--protein transferase [unclassified Polaromonas]AYQ29355.1 leucyl/phenylalanyl-tRNA--protein transferase [Polaromonas sp. SP1]QGJ19529.1 leucyl/phenylalanyl-tRNA--protein transferase [Polaromonas sp. Pch-P]